MKYTGKCNGHVLPSHLKNTLYFSRSKKLSLKLNKYQQRLQFWGKNIFILMNSLFPSMLGIEPELYKCQANALSLNYIQKHLIDSQLV